MTPRGVSNSCRVEAAWQRLAAAEEENARKKQAKEEKRNHAIQAKRIMENEHVRHASSKIERVEATVEAVRYRQQTEREERLRQAAHQRKQRAEAIEETARIRRLMAAQKEELLAKHLEAAAARHDITLHERQRIANETRLASEEAVAARKLEMSRFREMQSSSLDGAEANRMHHAYATIEETERQRLRSVQLHDARMKQAQTHADRIRSNQIRQLEARAQAEEMKHAKFLAEKEAALETKQQLNAERRRQRALVLEHTEKVRAMRAERYLQVYNEALEIGSLTKIQNSRFHL